MYYLNGDLLRYQKPILLYYGETGIHYFDDSVVDRIAPDWKIPKAERLPAAGKLNIHLRLPNFIGEVGRHHFFSSEKAIKELSYNPRKSSEEGIREMVRSVWQKS